MTRVPGRAAGAILARAHGGHRASGVAHPSNAGRDDRGAGSALYRGCTRAGVSRTRVFFQHALRNALLPVLTVGAAQLGALLSAR